MAFEKMVGVITNEPRESSSPEPPMNGGFGSEIPGELETNESGLKNWPASSQQAFGGADCGQ